MKELKDKYGSLLHEEEVDNGLLSFTVIPERGMDVGEICFKGKRISWDKGREYLIHPENVDLRKEGWDKGFYCAISSVGPEVFGTPDEVRTPHGTGAYSVCDYKDVQVNTKDDITEVTGTFNIKGYDKDPVYKKQVRVYTPANSHFLVREEVITNLTDERVPNDYGYHIQMCGKSFMENGGKYLLPVRPDRMLLRDSAPKENDPKDIYPYDQDFDPIRCYQYIPEQVKGLEMVADIKPCLKMMGDDKQPFTVECIVNADKTGLVFIVRPLAEFSRSLLAKRNMEDTMYAIEPCNTRPNSIKQKEIDGELRWLEPHESSVSHIAIGYTEDRVQINHLIQLIRDSY